MINDYRNKHLNNTIKIDSYCYATSMRDDNINLFEFKFNLKSEYLVSNSSVEREEKDLQTLLEEWTLQRKMQHG